MRELESFLRSPRCLGSAAIVNIVVEVALNTML
jgi:hypothetical protein